MMARKKWTKYEEDYLRKNYGKIDYNLISKHLNRNKKVISYKAYHMQITNKNLSNLKILMETIKLKNLKQKSFQNKREGYFYTGFIAGEGCFTSYSRKSGYKRFFFHITLADVDRKLLCTIKNFIGTGKVLWRKRKNKRWHDESIFLIQDNQSIWRNLIPFIDNFGLFNSHKQEQYERWKDDFKNQYNL